MTRADVAASSFDPSQVLIVDGGPHTPLLPDIAAPTLVIAADNGFEHAQALGIEVDVVVGDFDSVAPGRIETIDSRIILERHSVDKDDSDLALALRFAHRVGAQKIDIITGGNGRLDHLLIGSLLLVNSENLGRSIVTHCGSSRLVALAPGQPLALENLIGCWISLIALEAETLVRTEGLRWNLAPNDPFAPFSSLGLSNQILDSPVIEVRQGTLLVVVTSPDE